MPLIRLHICNVFIVDDGVIVDAILRKLGAGWRDIESLKCFFHAVVPCRLLVIIGEKVKTIYRVDKIFIIAYVCACTHHRPWAHHTLHSRAQLFSSSSSFLFSFLYVSKHKHTFIPINNLFYWFSDLTTKEGSRKTKENTQFFPF